MSTANLINALLDEYNNIKQDESNTDDTIENIINDINKIKNNGESINDVFNNIYYINDMSEDRRCSNAK